MARREYRVWNESGDLLERTTSRARAERITDRERENCPCGEDAGRDGNYCGVMSPHGISMQTVEDGLDVSHERY